MLEPCSNLPLNLISCITIHISNHPDVYWLVSNFKPIRLQYYFCLYNIYFHSNLSRRWTPTCISQLGTYSQTSLFMITYVHLNQIRLFISKSLLIVFSKQLHVWSYNTVVFIVVGFRPPLHINYDIQYCFQHIDS